MVSQKSCYCSAKIKLQMSLEGFCGDRTSTEAKLTIVILMFGSDGRIKNRQIIGDNNAHLVLRLKELRSLMRRHGHTNKRFVL